MWTAAFFQEQEGEQSLPFEELACLVGRVVVLWLALSF